MLYRRNHQSLQIFLKRFIAFYSQRTNTQNKLHLTQVSRAKSSLHIDNVLLKFVKKISAMHG